MPSNKNRRRPPHVLQENVDAYNSLQSMEGYKPTKEELSVPELKKLYEQMLTQQAIETQKEVEFRTAKDKAIVSELAFHEAIRSSKQQVIALFGDDSNEVEAVGLKKKSARKRTSSKAKLVKV